MTSTARSVWAVGMLGLPMACGGGSGEKAPAPPPWETAWSAENGADLGPHLERFAALRTAYAKVKDARGDAAIAPLDQSVEISKTAMLITEPALLDPSVNSGQQPTISLDGQGNPRLDQLTSLNQGGPVSSFFSVKRADHLLWELQGTQTVVILNLETDRDPEILDERSFVPGAIRGTAHVFDYASTAYLGRADFGATNSPEVSIRTGYDPLYLSTDLGRNTQAAIGSALQGVFPELSTPKAPKL
ncbi:MAG: hypothetical protein ACI9VR_002725 [Cognaticolwellia sp.]|jgi:hypothetical protein